MGYGLLSRRRDAVVFAAIALVVATVAGPSAARGQGLSARLEPAYQNTQTTQTDQAGATTRSEVDSILQRYRLTWDRVLGPELRLTAGGVIDDVRSWRSGDQEEFGGSTTSLLFANSTFGSALLGGGAGYDRRRIDVHPQFGPARLNEGLRLSGHWRPLGLPELDVQASRTNSFDADRATQDRSIDAVSAGLRYAPRRQLDLRYNVRLTETEDHLTGSGVEDVAQAGRVTYADRFFSDRLSVSSSYAADVARSRVVGGGSGEILTQQFPVTALSSIEALPATVQRITLAVNPGLIDGQTGVGAAVNIGSAPAISGDVANRHLGVQLADRLTTVNRIFVYVDTALPPELQGAYSWAAYQSEDNIDWVPIPIVAAVIYEPFQNRFEVRVADTRATYVKIVVRPLPAGVTTDPRFRNVFVSELQVYAATTPRGTAAESTRVAGALTAHAGYRILQVPALSFDSTLFLRHGRELSEYSYLVLNAVSAAHQLTRILRGSAQVQRLDDNQAADEHSVAYRYGATLFADVLPTVSGSLSYSGGTGESPDGGERQTDTVTALARAELYRGLDLFATAARSFVTSDLQGSSESTNVNAGVALVPHVRLSLSANYALTTATGGGQPFQRTQRVEGSALANPVGSVNVSVSVSRTLSGDVPNTLYNGTVSWSPLAGGALQLSLAYSQTVETSSETVQQFGSASARWAIRPGTFLDVGYSITDSDAPVAETQTRAFTAGLIISI